MAILLCQASLPYLFSLSSSNETDAREISRAHDENHDELRRNIKNKKRDEIIQTIKPEVTLLASIIHASFHLIKSARTCTGKMGQPTGIEALGMKHDVLSGGFFTSNRVQDTYGPTMNSYNDEIVNMSGTEESTLADCGMNNSKERTGRIMTMTDSNEGPAYGRTFTFVILCTLPSYFVQRAGRGGWNDIYALISRVFYNTLGFTNPGQRSIWPGLENHYVNRGIDEIQPNLRIMEKLRGQDRQRVHEEMRRDMLRRAHQEEMDQSVTNEERIKESETNDTTNQSKNRIVKIKSAQDSLAIRLGLHKFILLQKLLRKSVTLAW
eukprot:CAMPEP_0184867854 /NCGR_PEP_ID=MMETSP0580-20130426/27991_1 /TAXON_ID=1118495 /ORGANISM="Dactyliosolen fragilissimus" /LENGTH=322 /DNA_ID=CAMNT_0027368333 /DNA_START=27 /DNA_END=992 /DNA_ORIENTATION=+